MEAAAGAENTHAPIAANLIRQAREQYKEAAKAQREMKKATKGLKKAAAKQPPLHDVKQPRKTSDGQRRWQAFQRFIWAKMQKTNPNVPLKSAMHASAPLWVDGNPKEEVAAEFEEYLRENPMPSAEEEMAGRDAIRLAQMEQMELSRLTYFEKTLLTKMNDINDNVTRLIETLSPIEGGYRKTTRKHTINHKKSRKYRK